MASRRKDATQNRQELGLQAARHVATTAPDRGFCDAPGCQLPANQTCSKCGRAKYCCNACQKQDWTIRHEVACRRWVRIEHEKQANRTLEHERVLASTSVVDDVTKIVPADKDLNDPKGERIFEHM